MIAVASVHLLSICICWSGLDATDRNWEQDSYWGMRWYLRQPTEETEREVYFQTSTSSYQIHLSDTLGCRPNGVEPVGYSWCPVEADYIILSGFAHDTNISPLINVARGEFQLCKTK